MTSLPLAPSLPVPRLPARLWWRLLLVGAPVWLFAAAITELTRDDVLIPTVIVVGSFLIPLTLAAFALSRRTSGRLTLEVVGGGFLAAGTLGVVSTALLETYVAPAATATFVIIGLIEEAAKGVVIVLAARRISATTTHATAWSSVPSSAPGFAAFESSGYALTTLLQHAGAHAQIIDVMETEATRALLAPFGHILWTALLGGALFAASRDGGRRFAPSWRLALTFAGVVALHALWDESYGWAIMMAKGVTGAGWDLVWPNAQAWSETPTRAARVWFNVADDALLTLNALAGTVWITLAWRRLRRVDRAPVSP